MTPERARQLVTAYGCRLEQGNPAALVVINEAINFRYNVALADLSGIDEAAFISTITTGRAPRGRRSLPGIYRDYRYPDW